MTYNVFSGTLNPTHFTLTFDGVLRRLAASCGILWFSGRPAVSRRWEPDMQYHTMHDRKYIRAGDECRLLGANSEIE